ncbi:hypothetical protein ACU8V7_06615 [Zobellia nedashkovskayae]
MSGSIPNSSTGTAFAGWFQGKDTKADQDNVTLSLLAAFDASSAAGGGTDLRKALSLSTDSGETKNRWEIFCRSI